MSGQRPRLSNAGPNTYPAGEAIKGGMLVIANPDGKARKSVADSLLVLGVAETDGKPWVSPVSVDADGFDVINTAPIPDTVTVGFGRYVVTYTANCAWGQALKAGANGAVTPVTADGDPRLIVGYCDEPGGVVVATKATGLANISR